MSYSDNNPNRIPMFLVASSRETLMALMQANNIVNYKSYNYQTPAKEEDKWVVWFYGIAGQDTPILEEDLSKIPTEVGLVDVESSNGETEL